MPKFYNIDPETCSMDELIAARNACEQKAGYFGALEQGCKKFINSVYGALGSAFYACANTAIAESITAQGQHLIKFATRRVNYLLATLLPKLNEVTHPNFMMVNKFTNDVDDIVYYNSNPTPTESYMYAHYGFMTQKSIILGYEPLKRMLMKNDKLGLEDCVISINGSSYKGVRFELTADNIKYVYDRLDVFRRIGFDMIEYYPEFNMDDYMSRVSTGISFPTGTKKVDPETGAVVETFQVYGDTDSSYLTFHPVVEAYNVPKKIKTRFIISFCKHIVADYLKLQFDKYAKDFNCKENLEVFELEKIARSILIQRKKKYVMDIAWKEPDVYLDPLNTLVFKGVEATRGESSKYVRQEQREFVLWMMDNINNGKKIKYSDIVKKLKVIKDRFIMASPDDICKTVSMSDYEKYVVNDKSASVVFAGNAVIPQNVKSVAWYNNLLYTKYSHFRNKYDIIHKGDKIRLYYVKDIFSDEQQTFAFLPGHFPREFAPAIDMDQQFEKLILDPLNRYIEALGYSAISAKLTYKKSLY